MKNQIALPQGTKEWRARIVPDSNNTHYLRHQVVYFPEMMIWNHAWDPGRWHPGWVRPGIIVDPVFNTDRYRVRWWAWDSETQLFVPAFDPTEPATEVYYDNLAFFHFFPQSMVIPAFNALMGVY